MKMPSTPDVTDGSKDAQRRFSASGGSASELSYQQQLDAWKAKHDLTRTDAHLPVKEMMRRIKSPLDL